MAYRKLQNAYTIFVTGMLVMLLLLVGTGKLATYSGPMYTVPQPCGVYTLEGFYLNGQDAVDHTSAGGQYPPAASSPYVGSAWPGFSGTGAGEILDSSQYWISWVPGGISQSITMAGTVWTWPVFNNCGAPGFAGLGNKWDDAHYNLSIDTTGTGTVWQPFLTPLTPTAIVDAPGTYDISCGGAYQNQCSGGGKMNAYTFQVRGVTFNGTTGGNIGTGWAPSGQPLDIVDGSLLRVQIYLHETKGDNVCGTGCAGWYGPFASDYAILQRATPTVAFDQGLYPIGGAARLTWHVPVVTLGGVPAYYLTVWYPDSGTYVTANGVTYNQAPLMANDGVVSFTIPLTAFSSAPGALNKVKAHLYSQIFLAWADTSFTIDNVSLAPTITGVTWNKPSMQYLQGDTITVTINAAPNPTTNLPIVKYTMDLYLGGIDKEFVSSTNTITTTAWTSGLASAVVNAYDSANRPASPLKVTFVVGNSVGLCELFPTNPSCTTLPPPKVPGWITTTALILLLVGIPLLLVGLYLPLPLTIRVILAVAGIALTLIGAFLAVTVAVDWIASLIPGGGLPLKWW